MVDSFTVEIIRNAAIFISEEMGVVLRNTAYSPNIKDRLDHTCSVLTPKGELAAQAEHIPVHLGSMAVGVKNTLDYLEREGIYLEPGDIIVVNDPYIAGTHLNDILLMKPVYVKGKLIAIVADKAHHVDVGGSVPGSMGGEVRELSQEGIVIPPIKIVEKGTFKNDVIKLIAENVRTPEYFKGDLKAQIAALNVGERRIVELAEKYGPETILEAWDEILSYTERYTRNRIKSLGRFGKFEAEDYIELDDKLLKIKASVEIKDSGEVTVDFSGTDKQVEAPINAVYGVTVAATTFALKSVIDPEMPVNHGFYRVVQILAPSGTLVNPRKPAPVSGGNTETSQRIADVVFKALAEAFPERVPAASCGSMTNVAMGGIVNEKRWAFYETIGCGSGGRPKGDGIDGVHTNMTNTLNTPIERLEIEYPIIMVAYKLREDSEGPGTYRGGLGITRAFKLIKGKAIVTILAERCKTSPWGLQGGLPGERAQHYVVKKNGQIIKLKCKETIEIEEGDIVYINTPGGGGYGDPCQRDRKAILKDVEDRKISLERAKKKYCYVT
jgi:N-methylhydantoinase B